LVAEGGVEGGVHEAECGVEAFGGDADGEAEKVVVGVAGVEVDAFFDAEDDVGEDGVFAAAKAFSKARRSFWRRSGRPGWCRSRS
jgi:hypothetical protein